jgi:hypothetical protein
MIEAVDVVPYEKNLLRIGFFSAAERGRSKGKSDTSRRVSITVYPDGRREDRMITFTGSLGLPTTADRDKYIAFMRIVDELRARLGYVPNPVRFRGRRLLKELNLAASKQMYEAINDWGQRMVATSILSKAVIWFPNSRRFADKALNVFQEFSRVGKEDSSGRAEEYEVRLADWLVESLNSEYMFTEDYLPYLRLTTHIAKGIYGPLWLWFSANKKNVFAKDYLELCDFLDIKPHTELSRIKTQIGRAFDELVSLEYLAAWDIQKRAMDLSRYKIVMHAGPALLESLSRQKPNFSHPGSTFLLDSGNELSIQEEESLTPEASNAYQELIKLGVAKTKAQEYIREIDTGRILDLIDYACYKSTEKHSTIRDRTSFLCWLLNTGSSIPSNFVTSRQKELAAESTSLEEQHHQQKIDYEIWTRQRAEEELSKKYSPAELEKNDAIAEFAKTNPKFAKVPVEHRHEAVRAALVSEVREKMVLPTFEQWSKEHAQRELFSR